MPYDDFEEGLDDEGYVCPRCEAAGVANDDPGSEFCPGCGKHSDEKDD